MKTSRKETKSTDFRRKHDYTDDIISAKFPSNFLNAMNILFSSLN